MSRWLLLFTGCFAISIGLVLLIAPQSYLGLYAVNYTPDMDFAARRFSPAVLGLGALLLIARNLPGSRFLANLCLITGLVFLGVAATGLHAWLGGTARATILIAAATEVTLAALFLVAASQIRKSR
ncbi:hypothetical protein ACGKZZ_15090 [Marivita sp. S2033]